jgi:hypothetical protein
MPAFGVVSKQRSPPGGCGLVHSDRLVTIKKLPLRRHGLLRIIFHVLYTYVSENLKTPKIRQRRKVDRQSEVVTSV